MKRIASIPDEPLPGRRSELRIKLMTSRLLNPTGVAIAAVTALNFVVWVFLYRNNFLKEDEYYHSLNSGSGLYGSSSLTEIAKSALYYYFNQPGRIADVMVKASMSLGPVWWKYFGPLVFAMFALAVWFFYRTIVARFVNTSGLDHSPVSPTVAYFAICLIPIAMVGAYSEMGRTMMYFYSAVVGYVITFSLLFILLGLLLRQPIGTLSGRMTALLSLLALPLGVLNEIVALMAIGALLFLTVSPLAKGCRWRFGAIAAAASLGFMVFYVAPGRVTRTDWLNGIESLGLGSKVITGILAFWASGGVLQILTVGVIIASIVATNFLGGSRHSRSWIAAPVGVVAWVAALILYIYSQRPVISSSTVNFTAEFIKVLTTGDKIVAVACTMIFFGGLLFIIWSLCTQIRHVYYLFVSMVAGAMAIPLYIGYGAVRVYFHAVYTVLLLGILSVVVLVSYLPRKLAAVGAVAGIGLAGTFAIIGIVTSQHNLAYINNIWAPVEEELKAAHVTNPDLIVIPGPERFDGIDWDVALPREGTKGQELFRKWYQIPDDTAIEWH